jgi:hypothetical protein
MAVPSRLAVSGDELVVHRFDAKSVGLAAGVDVRRGLEDRNAGTDGLWTRLRKFLRLVDAPIRTVCIPPGARLLIRDISTKLQRECGFCEEDEEAVFTQISSAVNTFRDAVRFQNGVVVLLQRLDEGQSVRVVDLSSAEEQVTAPKGRQRVLS